jgi:hypothetical protein
MGAALNRAIAIAVSCLLLCACNANTQSNQSESNNPIDATAAPAPATANQPDTAAAPAGSTASQPAADAAANQPDTPSEVEATPNQPDATAAQADAAAAPPPVAPNADQVVAPAPIPPCQGNRFIVGEYALTITPARNGDSLDLSVVIQNAADYPVNWFRAVPPPLLMHAFKLADNSGKSYAVSGLGELDPIRVENKVIAPKTGISGTVSFNVPRADYTLQVLQILGSDKNMTTSTILQCSAEISH